MSHQLSAVLPLLLRDVERSKILLTTLDQFLERRSLKELVVICRDEEAPDVASRLGAEPTRHTWRIVRETQLIAPADRAHYSRFVPWCRQQVLKLAASRVVRTDHYLVLDADVICCRSVRFGDLVRNGRAALTAETKTRHPDWWAASGRVLKFSSQSEEGIAATPELLVTRQVRDLCKHVEGLHGCRWIEALAVHGGAWTEFTLYYTFLEKNGVIDAVHMRDCPVMCFGPAMNVWWADQFPIWNVDDVFSRSPGFFTVVQSHTGIHPTAIWARISRYLSGPMPVFVDEADATSPLGQCLSASRRDPPKGGRRRRLHPLVRTGWLR